MPYWEPGQGRVVSIRHERESRANWGNNEIRNMKCAVRGGKYEVALTLCL